MLKISTILTLCTLGVIAGRPSLTHAQILAEVRDSTCTDAGGSECAGPASQGCGRVSFTLQAGFEGDLCAHLNCRLSTGCTACLSVTYLYSATGVNPLLCLHTFCDEGCEPHCAPVELSAGSYYLYACKIPCPTHDCDDGSADCVAGAIIANFPKP